MIQAKLTKKFFNKLISGKSSVISGSNGKYYLTDLKISLEEKGLWSNKIKCIAKDKDNDIILNFEIDKAGLIILGDFSLELVVDNDLFKGEIEEAIKDNLDWFGKLLNTIEKK